MIITIMRVIDWVGEFKFKRWLLKYWFVNVSKCCKP